MRIALGSDHAGYDLKTLVKSTLVDWGYEVVDLGTDNANDPVDYPDFAAAVGYAVVQGDAELGVAMCGSGIGVSIAANKVPGVRAAVVHDVTSAHLAREHIHANGPVFRRSPDGSRRRDRVARRVAGCGARTASCVADRQARST